MELTDRNMPSRNLKDRNSTSLNETSLPPMPAARDCAARACTTAPTNVRACCTYSDTQHYWCNVTMDPHGPDERHAGPESVPTRAGLLHGGRVGAHSAHCGSTHSN